jgi:hypothetical protein
MGVFWVGPLSAQDRDISIVPAQVTNEITVNGDTIVVNVNVMSDSVALANLNRNLEALRQQIADSECNTCGGGTNTTVVLGVVGPLLLWIAISAHRSAGKDDSHTINTEVNVPPREKRPKNEDSEH